MNNIILELETILASNLDTISFLYSRETDLIYNELRLKVLKSGYADFQKEIAAFYTVRLKRDVFREILDFSDNYTSKHLESKSKPVFSDFYNHISSISGRKEFSFSSKLLNLTFQEFPLYDSRVREFLELVGFEFKEDDTLVYQDLKTLYDLIISTPSTMKIINELKKVIYSGITLPHVNEIKFIDTVFYSIGNGKKISLINSYRGGVH